MRIRQYSISSSPLHNPQTCSLTYAVVDAPAPPSSKPEHHHLGVATTYLSSLVPGDKFLVSVRPSHTAFHPPLDIANIPVLMFCAGSGLAPFRAFVQERACQLAAGRTLAPALLFIGCRYPDRDRLYHAELTRWEQQGAVKIYYAFSRAPEESGGCQYVQERLWRERKEAVELWEKGAKIYVCGSGAVGEGVREVVCRAYEEAAEKLGKKKTKEEIEAWFAGIREERFASDVFA